MDTQNRRPARGKLALVLLAGLAGLGVVASGCTRRELKPLNPCLVSSVNATIAVDGVDKVDLLFAIDNSGSMVDEQAKVADQLPALIRTLVSGQREGSDETFPPAKDLHLGVITTDMGTPGLASLDEVIAAGLGCSDFGDDGRLRAFSAASSGSCADVTLPGDDRFIAYEAGGSATSDSVAELFGCLAQVGEKGCGYEMQLESTLKALWPYPTYDINPKTGLPYVNPDTGEAVDPTTGMPYARITFLVSADENAQRLHRYGQGGDSVLALDENGATYEVDTVDETVVKDGTKITTTATTLANNAGFLRNSNSDGLSLIAVIVVTDEEDCSSRTVRHFHPTGDYGPNSPYPDDASTLPKINENLRCWYFRDSYIDNDESKGTYLHSVDRYVKGLQALRPGNENLVIFGAIAGVPPDLVSADTLDAVDFSNSSERDAFYATILDDSRMVQRTNETMTGLVEACRVDSDEPSDENSAASRGADPARRLVQTAEKFGENGIIQSICQESFEPAIDAIIDVIAKQLGAVCLPRQLVRQSDGTVACKVIWELPTADDGSASVEAPRSCDDPNYTFLQTPQDGVVSTSDGRARCEVTQLAVVNDSLVDPSAEGWYYDDFSMAVNQQCRGDDRQRVAFTNSPPNGVTVQLECLNETQTVPLNLNEVDQDYYSNLGLDAPTIGTPCAGSDARCVLHRSDETTDDSLFCHQARNVCIRRCNSDTDCPPAWVCDVDDVLGERAAASGGDVNGSAFCVNPTCDTD